jgi:hypothetical protein
MTYKPNYAYGTDSDSESDHHEKIYIAYHSDYIEMRPRERDLEFEKEMEKQDRDGKIYEEACKHIIIAHGSYLLANISELATAVNLDKGILEEKLVESFTLRQPTAEELQDCIPDPQDQSAEDLLTLWTHVSSKTTVEDLEYEFMREASRHYLYHYYF